MLRVLLIASYYLFWVHAANACIFSKEAMYTDPTMGCPDDIRDMAQRMLMCIHWSGEEPYNTQRRLQIEKGLEAEHCALFACDMQAILKRYKGQPEEHLVSHEMLNQWIEVYGKESTECINQ